MRILLTTDPIGGVWTFTRELSQELLRGGHSVHLVSFGRLLSKTQAQWCADTTLSASGGFSWEASDAPLEWMQGNEQTWPAGAAVIENAVRCFNPDVLHSNQFCFGALSGSLPCVLTAHSDVLSWGKACRPDGLADSPWLQTYRELVHRGLDGATCVAAPSRWMADVLANVWGVRTGVRVIPNGRSIRPGTHRDARCMGALSAGRLWDEGKCIRILFEREWPVPVLIAGEEMFGEEQRNRHTGVEALGVLSEEALLTKMRELAIYVATSIYEPFGLTPLEAARSGCALVLRDIPSLREIWGDAALYFADADALYRVLVTLRDDAHLLKTMRDAAVRHGAMYQASSMAAAYLGLYEEAIASRGYVRSVPGEHWESDAA